MSNDAADPQPTTDSADSGDAGDLAQGDFDTALIPQEDGEGSTGLSANRAKADSDPETEPDHTGAGDKNTDPNAQPPA